MMGTITYTAIALAQSEKSREYYLILLDNGKCYYNNVSQKLTGLKKYMLSLKNYRLE